MARHTCSAFHRVSIRGIDPEVYEYVLRPSFWILAVLLSITWLLVIWAKAPHTTISRDASAATVTEAASKSELDEGASTTPSAATAQSDAFSITTSTASSGGDRRPNFRLWLVPFLSQKRYRRRRRIFTLVFYSGLLAVALLEAYWIGVTLTRITTRMVDFWKKFAKRGHPSWVLATGSLGVIGMLGVDAATLLLGSFVVVPLVCCVVELLCLKVPDDVESDGNYQ
ncbi:hypothetical protein BX600DRAFT_499778 [Xylariales sp. PMI_506]|nr:hypothetical protein BX600DRAFT_499778 [Xylariales sp. PMI_506]